jgi:Papain family cysteine protease
MMLNTLYSILGLTAVIGPLAIGAASLLGEHVLAQERELPAVVDLRSWQTSIRNQAGRDSCTYFPPIAALEAAYRRRGVRVNLSVEHLIWNRNETAASDGKETTVTENLLCTQTGGGVIANFELLSRYGVSPAMDMPYLPNNEDRHAPTYHGFDVADYKWWEPFRQMPLNCFNLDPAHYPLAAREHARYGIKKFVVYRDGACQDPRKIEEALADHHEVAVNMLLWDADPADKGHGGVPSIVWYRSKNAKVRPGNSHGMLLVGYDHPRQFFIVKNSWGPNTAGYKPNQLPNGWKDIAHYKGYTLIHYSWLSGNCEAAFITEVVDPESDYFRRQRALGLWEIKIQEKGTKRTVASAVLAWRRLPDNMKDPKHDLRVGDLYWGGKEFRVNARLSGSSPVQATFFVDFDHPDTSIYDDRGLQIHGELSLPDEKPATIVGAKFAAPPGAKSPFGVPLADLTMSAVQSTGNPLQLPAARPVTANRATRTHLGKQNAALP